MLKHLVSFLIIATALCSYAQNSKWSIEASYPYTFGDNFVDEGYNGAADLGLKYRFASYDALDLGASFNVGAFIRDDGRFDNNIDASGSAVLFQSRMFASFKFASYPQIHPMVGLGYSIFAFSLDGQNFAGANFQENSSDDGVNLNFAVAYDVSNHLFVQVQFDYVRLSARDVLDSPYNRNVNIIKLGIGYRL